MGFNTFHYNTYTKVQFLYFKYNYAFIEYLVYQIKLCVYSQAISVTTKYKNFIN